MKRILSRLGKGVIGLFLASFIIFGVMLFHVERIDLETYLHSEDHARYLALPMWGENYAANSTLGYALGRHYLKGAVAATILEAYQILERHMPETHFIYGEMGLKGGGRFYPHRTHQSGMSADFITPVFRVKDGERYSATLPTNIFQLWGYHVRLDNTGKYREYQLDATALIAHLAALDQAGRKRNIRIKRVILDPVYVKLLRKEATFKQIQHLNFMQSKAWFPHDGHYHVDFQ